MKDVIKSFRLCVLAITLACGAGSALGQTQLAFTRTILGVVIDKENQPISHANVCAWGTGPINGRLPCGQSGPDGHFAINVYRPDTYTITAEQLEQGYPEAIWGFYGKLFSNYPSVIVGDTSAVPLVTVQLGPKAGRMIFTILDADTGKPIDKGSIKVCRVGEPLSCWSKSTAFPRGKYELLTPEVPFTVKFETWEVAGWVKRSAFDESGVPIEIVQVDLGARKEITVKLK